ncbi:MAG: hypothetical protein F6J94_13895 [Moorea sp. SIO1F2]|nr:hypothetical protein [Moorena sp. SIO1F2]
MPIPQIGTSKMPIPQIGTSKMPIPQIGTGILPIRNGQDAHSTKLLKLSHI